jgi:hypothetical protein
MHLKMSTRFIINTVQSIFLNLTKYRDKILNIIQTRVNSLTNSKFLFYSFNLLERLLLVTIYFLAMLFKDSLF